VKRSYLTSWFNPAQCNVPPHESQVIILEEKYEDSLPIYGMRK
jgi:hypothetical protein